MEITTTNYYTSPFQVRSRHYTRAFKKLGYKVLFITNPISSIKNFFADNKQPVERKHLYGTNS